MLYRAVRQHRVPLVLRIAAHTLLLVALALIIYAWVIGMQFKHAMAQQADALGQSLTVQTAASATELLVSNDILSLNVLLGNLVKNRLVAHAAIYSVDNRVLAESGTRPQKGLLGDDSGLYSTPISFQEVIAGHLRVSLDMQQFQQPMTISLQSMGLLSLILLALTLMLSLRLGRQLATPLMQMRLWLRDPDDPAPGAGRQDEIGDLARQLQARLVPEKPEPELELDDEPLLDEVDGSIAVITPARHAARVADLIDHESGRVVVLDPMSTKGLEWDATVVVDPDAIVAESSGGARVLYVALTRAAHRMTVLRPMA